MNSENDKTTNDEATSYKKLQTEIQKIDYKQVPEGAISSLQMTLHRQQIYILINERNARAAVN